MVQRTFAFRLALLLLAGTMFALASPRARAAEKKPVPDWIWSRLQANDNEEVYFRKTIAVADDIKSAKVVASCDNEFTLFVNGEKVLESNVWSEPAAADVAKLLKPGKNTLAVRGKNEGGIAAFISKLTIQSKSGAAPQVFMTDTTWKFSSNKAAGWNKPEFDDSKWTPVVSIGKLGDTPWGSVSLDGVKAGAGKGQVATSEENITVPPGFKVELIHSVPIAQEGSWVSMTPDPKGRLIVCDQNGPLYRVTPGANAETTKVEKLAADIGSAQGLLYAYDSLYVMVNGGKKGNGLYRLRDTKGTDQFDEVKLIKRLDGGGEHGPHAIRLGPDGKLYVVAGNFTKIPEGAEGHSPHRNWAEDILLPRNPDGGGHDPHIMAPGGWIARTDKDGKEWEVLCAGLRNTYDFAFNNVGEIFNFDSDMEWDTGAPWYRPTRVNHCVSGGEFGWRNGTGKWPEYYIDSLGAVANIGLGSPTGVEFGYGAKFPAKYQHAFYINDWTYGKIYAVHLQENGATYTSDFEVFAQGRPLPVTDICVNHDGALYFTIGGRGTQSGLYRITYVGKESTAPVEPKSDPKAAEARAIRQKLEAFHGKPDPKAVAFAWPYLNSTDRSLRYAARVAVEWQDPASWREKALTEKRTTAFLQAAVALIRSGKSGDAQLESQIVSRLNGLAFNKLTEEQKLDALRVYGLAFIRLGKPDDKVAQETIAALSPNFPGPNENVNHELLEVLTYLQWPGVVSRGMEQLKAAQTQQDQLFYVFVLRNMATGWTPEQRKAYFSFLNLAETKYKGGNSFRNFMKKIRQDAVDKLTAAEKESLKEVIEGKQNVATVTLETTRQFVHNWQMSDLESLLENVERGRNFEAGKAAFQAAQCAKCHRFQNDGGSTGPDITGVGARFNPQYILEAVLVPSKVISDQYQQSIITTEDGEVFTGRVLEENAERIVVRTDPFAVQTREIPKNKIEVRKPSTTSEMPQGLVNVLTQDEILDMIAYLRSAGDPNDKAFKK